MVTSTYAVRVIILLSLCMVPLASRQATAASTEERKLANRVQEEIARRQAIKQWIREARPRQEAIVLRSYAPVITGNQEDFKRNTDLSQRFRSRAAEAAQRQDAEKARKYATVSKLFFDCAQVNREILLAIREGGPGRIDAAFEKMQKLEDQIFDITQNRVEREWFTPAEFEAYKRMFEQQQKDEDEDSPNRREMSNRRPEEPIE